MSSIRLIIFILLPLLGAADARSLNAGALNILGRGDSEVKDDTTCQDCIHIFEIFKHLLSDQDFQVKVKDSLETFCEALPQPVSKSCRSSVEMNFALAVSFISSLLVPGQVCAYFNLCEGEFQEKTEDDFETRVHETFTAPDMKLDASIPCSACTYVLNTLDCAVPRAQTESAVMGALGEACALLPLIFRGQCARLTQRYVKMLFEVLLDPASPGSVCAKLRLCQLPATATPGDGGVPAQRSASRLSDCDSCLTLAVLARPSLGPNATLQHVATFLQSVCLSHPDALPECQSFVQHHDRQLQSILGKGGDVLDLCETAALCVRRGHEDVVRDTEDFGDPCSLGPRYTCRDRYTAQSCGMVPFCQKNVWS